MKLRTRLNLVLAGLGAVFVTVLLVAEVQSARVSISEEITAANRVAAQLLGHVATVYSGDRTAEPLLQFLDELGRVRAHDITLLSPSNEVLYRSPASTWKAGRYAPDWFARLLTPEEGRHVFPLDGGGTLVLEADASRAVLDGWDAFVWLVSVAAVMLAAVSSIAFWLVGRALRPFPVIAEGLARIRRGELGFRLPTLPGAEARVIGEAFNGMAQAVEEKVAVERKAREAEHRLDERREWSRVIEQRVEEERRLIAHELHDEFSQSVTAIRSMALAIAAQTRRPLSNAGDARAGTSTARSGARDRKTADANATNTAGADTGDTAQLIAAEAARLYDAMHGLIPRLVPMTLDSLGLGETLENLVRDWQRRCPSIRLSLHYRLDCELGHSATLAIYRIVQEALINALRHAQPSRVDISVHFDSSGGAGGNVVHVSIIDDGIGLPAEWSRPGHFGLRGLAERVESLNGRFSVADRAPHGVAVTADIPLTDAETES